MTSHDHEIQLILKAARETVGISRDRLAVLTHYTSGHIANIENGNRKVTVEVVERYAQALGAPLLVDLWEGDAMHRRTAVSALGLLGTFGFTGSAALSEALRVSILDRFGATDENDWYEVTNHLGKTFMTAPASESHETIGAHLIAMLGGQNLAPGTRDAAARLMLLRAITTANLGSLHHAFAWYHAARRLADSSGDLHLINWIRGREATRRGYEDASPDDVLTLTAGLDCAEGYLANAQAFARIGERGQAVNALKAAERAYPQTNQSEGTIFGFQPWRYNMAVAYVWALLGETQKAESEIESTNLPDSMVRFDAQRQLTRAVALARVGDIAEARPIAEKVISSHPAEQQSMIITSMLKEISPGGLRP